MLRNRVALASLSALILAFIPSAGQASDLAARLGDANRPEADVARDAGRKPAEVLAFVGIQEGMTVMDLIAASGYYTEVLSVAVGDTGKVYAQNSPYVLEMRDGANDKAITKRLKDGRLANVTRLDRELEDLGIAPNSLDAALTALNFHDIYNGGSPEAATQFLNRVAHYLKPGGLLAVIDHVGNADANNADLHRITEAQAKQAIKDSVLSLEAESPLLRSPIDDHTKMVFDKTIRGRTDRFVYRIRKPE
jgi:predicted methyltransferase